MLRIQLMELLILVFITPFYDNLDCRESGGVISLLPVYTVTSFLNINALRCKGFTSEYHSPNWITNTTIVVGYDEHCYVVELKEYDTLSEASFQLISNIGVQEDSIPCRFHVQYFELWEAIIIGGNNFSEIGLLFKTISGT